MICVDARLVVGAMAACFFSISVFGGVNVLTYHNDSGRTGRNLRERTLTPENVNVNSFVKLFSYAVDGYVYAQPLYVSGLNIPGMGKRNVIFVATQHNSVYAFDADSNGGPNGGLLWHVNLGPSAPTPSGDLAFHAIVPEVGITGTPVIDLGSKTLYVDAFTQEGGGFFHRVHALSLINGSERPFSPVEVKVSVPGVGVGSADGVLEFQPRQQLQRSALTLANGKLYVSFAGFTDMADSDPTHGWIIGFKASTLKLLPQYVFNTTPNGTIAAFGQIAGRGSIWMAGNGPAVDANNNLYFATGDGNFNAFVDSGGTEYGDSVVKLSTRGGLSVADYFTPFNQEYYQIHDLDVGSGGIMLLPTRPGRFPHLMIAGGKPGFAYLINRDRMTTDNNHYDSTGTEDKILQTMPLTGSSFSTPAYFKGTIYYAANNSFLRGYVVSRGKLIPDMPNLIGPRKYSFPGATPSVSASDDRHGIVWTVQFANPAVLSAYDATDLRQEIYNSTQAGSRDQLPNGVKFVVPTIAHGKVYVGAQNALTVFGLLPNDSATSASPR